MDDPVVTELARARQRLLDLTLRNRLLNFRPTRRTTIRVVDELPGQVWQLLVEQGKKLAFLAREEHELFEAEAGGEGDSGPADGAPAGAAPPAPWFGTGAAGAPAEAPCEPAPEAPGPPCPQADDLGRPGGEARGPLAQPELATALEEGQELPARHTDLFLQTDLPGEELQTNLLRIERQARSALEERGVNLLFLALGFLEWRPENEPDRLARAPLVLVPVGLERSSARRRFKLRSLDDEPILNPCLMQKLQDVRIGLPQPPETWEGFDVEGYFRAVRAAVEGQGNWRVCPEIYVGFFSFTKYLMYVDLAAERRPADRSLLTNPLIRAVCGDDQAARDLPALTEPPGAAKPNGLASPEEVFQVLDADSSQQEAILAAKRGASLVIEGPPGTGKSQTIGNIIAECLAAGRTVLFVSEKRAALEVVKRRLDAVGLGEFCLELHSTKANRRSVVEELGAVLEKGRYEVRKPPAGAGKLQRLQERLDAYVAALHEPFGESGFTPYHAIGRVALLEDVPDVFCRIGGHRDWDAHRLGRMKDLADRLGRQIGEVAPLADNPWRGSRLRSLNAEGKRAVAGLCRAAGQALEAVRAAAGEVAALLAAQRPATIEAVGSLCDAAATVLETPSPPDRLLEGEIWDEPAPELRAFLHKLKQMVEGVQWMKGRYRWEALDAAEWHGVYQRCRQYWASALRWLRPAYWSDRAALKRSREAGHRPRRAELAGDLKELAEIQRTQEELVARDGPGVEYFGEAWRGAATDWSALMKLADWLGAFRGLVRSGAIGSGGVELARAGADRRPLADALTALHDKRSAWSAAAAALRGALLSPDDGFPTEPGDLPCDDVARRLDRMRREIDSLFDWARYQDVLQECEAGPAAEFVARAAAEDVEPETLALALEKQFFRLWMEDVLAEREPLRRFHGPDHEADAVAFARLDRQWVEKTGYRLHGKLASQRPEGVSRAARSSQIGILQGEIRRKRGGRPIRRLLRDAGDAIRRLKPCFMMSPLSVAQFLDPEGLRFDVVVFDEASQVEPADALGAIARGGQLVLVGDPKQLPPTSFFDAIAGEGVRRAESGPAGLVDMESILDRGTMVLPTRRLRWHYRSRHDSLIAFSNNEFYSGELVTFPSCHAGTDEMGLAVVYEPADLYDRGRGQTNRGQARRIAEWVFEHARSRPELSLGVGAFSQRQQQAVLDEVERLRRADESQEAFFDLQKPEPFFVKNLETIQGDERDVILLSVGYGKTARDDRLSMNFGPLNQEGGWRRLNVLITRARQRCVVFTSIAAEDFDLAATQARGVHALHGYLSYARSGSLPAVEAGGEASEAPFEQAVYNALHERGLRLARNVGCREHAVDLAVVDPDRPGRYLLGIECDGALYRDSATARDRDRLRQQVLESLGWRVHRVWSVDWFRSPAKEAERVLASIRKARSGLLKPKLWTAARARRRAPLRPGEPYAEVDSGLDVPLYEHYESRSAYTAEDFYAAAADRLVELVVEIADAEGPVHHDELVRRAAALYGFSRVGPRIEAKIKRAVSLAVSRGRLARREEFIWPKDMTDPPVRRRAEDDEGARDVERICLEEIGRAARLLLAAQFGMSRDDLIGQTARLLGFAHTGARLQERIGQAIDAEGGAGRIRTDEDGLLQVAS